MRFEFLSLDYLWFLLIIPLFITIHLFMLNYSQCKALKFANLEAIARVSKGRAGMGFGSAVNKDFFVLLRRVLILLVFVFSVAQPVLYYEGVTSGFDYVVAIDNSLSMSAKDLQPNRLDAAKEATSRFIDLVGDNSYVGLIGFSSTVLVVDNADLDKLELSKSGGTAIGDAIITGSNLLDSYTRGKAIILLTDGQNNAGRSIGDAIVYAESKNIMVHTIGVGTEEGGLLDIGIISTLHEEELMNLSSSTRGIYERADSVDLLDKVFDNIVVFETSELSVSLGWWLLLVGFLLILLEWLLFDTFYKVVK